jgi:hypothetical protein
MVGTVTPPVRSLRGVPAIPVGVWFPDHHADPDWNVSHADAQEPPVFEPVIRVLPGKLIRMA